MDLRNRIGLYGSYFLGMAGIGFTLPYLPLYLRQEGLSDRSISFLSTLAALSALVQFPLGLWSDYLGRRRPFLVALLILLAVATALLHGAHGLFWLGLLVVLFAENGLCRASVESLAGAAAAHLARRDEVGAALGALRFWRPVGIVSVALAGGLLAEYVPIATLLWPLTALSGLAVVLALLVHEESATKETQPEANPPPPTNGKGRGLRDPVLWLFVTAMILFHVCNAPAGVYLGLFLKQDLGAANLHLPLAFVVSMIAWMIAVRFAGFLADRVGRKPLLLAAWSAMAVRLALLSLTTNAQQVLVVQILDGTAQALFAVAAAAWVTDRLADPRRVGEAQALVGCSLVFGSAVGPLLSGLVVEALGYRDLFRLLAGIGISATVLVAFVPETLGVRQPATDAGGESPKKQSA